MAIPGPIKELPVSAELSEAEGKPWAALRPDHRSPEAACERLEDWPVAGATVTVAVTLGPGLPLASFCEATR